MATQEKGKDATPRSPDQLDNPSHSIDPSHKEPSSSDHMGATQPDVAPVAPVTKAGAEDEQKTHTEKRVEKDIDPTDELTPG